MEVAVMLKGNFKRKKLLLLFFVLCLTLTFSPVNAFADDPINSYDTVRSFDNAEMISVLVKKDITFGDGIESYYIANLSEGRYRMYIYEDYGNDSNDYFWVEMYDSEENAVNYENVIVGEGELVNSDNADADYREYVVSGGKYYIVVGAVYKDSNKVAIKFVPLDENGKEMETYDPDDEGDYSDESDMDVPLSNWLTDAEITGFKKSKTYTGKAVKQNLTIKIMTTQGEYRTLVENEDYKVTYKKNKNVGQAKMIISGLEHFKNSPTITKKFKIVPKGSYITNLSSKRTGSKARLAVKWYRQSLKMSESRINGYQVMIATDSKFTKNEKTITFKSYRKNSTTIKNLLRTKTYYCKVRTYKVVDGTRYYSGWSKVKKIKTK